MGEMRSISFLQYLIIPEPQHLKSSFLQTPVSSLVTLVFRVLSAIDLNKQPPFQAYKIQYEIQLRMLAAEFTAGQLPAA